MTHRRVWPKPLGVVPAWSFFDSLFRLPHFSVLVETPHHPELLRELVAEYSLISGNLLRDFHTVVLMKEHGVSEIRTADTEFQRFRFLRVVNPLAET